MTKKVYKWSHTKSKKNEKLKERIKLLIKNATKTYWKLEEGGAWLNAEDIFIDLNRRIYEVKGGKFDN